ncbi:MAG: esterase family protein [Lactobacillales bacterium]|jgi:putative tributyrin esterase|nr:esterase family protein [Lactobacillales bacterium]
MAFFQINYYSNTLQMEQVMNVILPERNENHPEWTAEGLQDIPVLYLLHGMGGNHSAWERRTSIERLVRNTKLAIIMPNTDLAWYTNTTYGLNYFDHLAKELPETVHAFFPQISTKREKTFTAGLSMGGYGAWKLALGTNTFGAAASLSGALYLSDMANELTEMGNQPYWQGVLGDLSKVHGSENDLIALAENKVKNNEELPKLFAWCGEQDFLFQANEIATSKVKELGYDVTYEKNAGTHEWYYWDKYIEHVLEWLPIDYQKEERLS